MKLIPLSHFGSSKHTTNKSKASTGSWQVPGVRWSCCQILPAGEHQNDTQEPERCGVPIRILIQYVCDGIGLPQYTLQSATSPISPTLNEAVMDQRTFTRSRKVMKWHSSGSKSSHATSGCSEMVVDLLLLAQVITL